MSTVLPSEGAPRGQWGWALIAIERDGAGWHLSRAYDFKADEHLAVVDIRDIEGEGGADVIYCAWYAGQDELVPARALGYRNHHWYPMDLRSPGAETASASRGGTRPVTDRVNDDCRAESDGKARGEAATDGTGSDR